MAFSATRAAFEGLRLVGRRPASILLGWTLFYAVAYALIIGAVVLTAGVTMISEVLQEKDRVINDPAEVWGIFASFGLAGLILVGGLLVVSAIQLAAVYRAVLRPQERGFAYLKLGGDELRQVLLMVLMTLFFLLVIGGLTAGLAFGLMVADLERTATVPLAIAGGVVIFILMVLLSVRLSLAPAMTFAQRRLRFFGSWTLTRGRFWPLVGMYLLALVLCIIAYVIGELLAGMIFVGAGLSLDMFLTGRPPSVTEIGGPTIAAGAGAALVWLMSSAVQMAIMYGPQAVAYRDLMAERNPPREPEPTVAPAPESPVAPVAGPAFAAAAAGASAEAAPTTASHDGEPIAPGVTEAETPTSGPEAAPDASLPEQPAHPAAEGEPAAAPAPVAEHPVAPAPELHAEPPSGWSAPAPQPEAGASAAPEASEPAAAEPTPAEPAHTSEEPPAPAAPETGDGEPAGQPPASDDDPHHPSKEH